MKRSIVIAVLLSALVVLAGCSDGGSTAGPGDGPGTGDGPGDGDGSGLGDGTDEVNFFEFDTPGRYVYDVEMDGDTGQVVWDITAVDGEEITVKVDYDVGPDSYSSTVTGTKEDIQSQLLFSPAGSFVMLGMFSPMFGYYDGESMYVGKEWSYTAPDGSGSMSFEITETETFGGVDCYASELRINDSVLHEACFSPDLGLAANTVWYDEETGEVDMRMELTDYERN